MGSDKHADARSEMVSTLRVACEDLVAQARNGTLSHHQRERDRLWDVFKALDNSQHGRARRVAVERILAAHDKHGSAAFNLVMSLWEKARGARNPTRYFLAAVVGEMNARRW